MPRLALLAVKSPEHRQAEVAVLAKRQRDGDTQTTQFKPNRSVLCFLDESTAWRKMPPKATLAPRLWQSVSSTTNQTTPPGIKWLKIKVTSTMPKSSHSHAAEWKTA